MKAETAALDAASEFERAVAAMNLGRWPEALDGFESVLRAEPGHFPSLVNRGICLSRLERHAEALASIEAALAARPSDPIALNNRGEELQKLLRPEEALESYDAALAAAPDFAVAHGNRGYLLAQLGRPEAAAAALERAIELNPSHTRSYQHLAPLRRFTPEDPVLARMQALARRADGLSVDGRIELGFALAKALGDIGEHAQAFEQLSVANRLKRSSFRYDEAAALAELDRVGAVFGKELLQHQGAAGDPEPSPILIVGMPRSGSTLVEQILASHPKVFAAGENTAFDVALAETMQVQGVERSPEGAARLSPEAVRELGANYRRRLSQGAPAGARIVDKTLSNLRYLGLVHAALPGARIVHVRRNAVDACMSCYSLLFGAGQPFAYELGELGRHYRALERLMRHWRKVLPGEALLDIKYEAVIADPEVQVRRLLEHCGLEWDPRCLDFHRTERQVRTSSASQVRRPLYASSVGASRVYRPYLGPLIEALDSRPHEDPAAVVLGENGHLGDFSAMAVEELERRAASGDAGAQRALAERLDAEGRHTDAIDWLARAGSAGDLEALTRLGVRLLTGKDAPFLPNDGARLLGEAANAGGTEAMERLAVLIGGGFYARQSWEMALNLLAQAAEGGSAHAQAQLRLLAASGASEASWSSLRQAVDVPAWTASPAPRVLSESPRILAVDGLIPPEACDWIIEQSAGRLVRAALYDPATGQPMLGTETRLNKIANFDLAQTDLANLFVQARIAATVRAPMQVLEAFAVLHYDPGEEYGEHVDYLDPAIAAYGAELAQRGQRVATCLIYLNDDYEGGQTEFPQLGLSFKGRKGDALIFFSVDASGRPDPRTVHAGRTPTSGEKWLLSQFLRDRPVVGAAARHA